METKQSNVAVFGARGYAGIELIRLLLRHSHVKVTAALATEASFAIEDSVAGARGAGIRSLPISRADEALEGADFAFLATPAEVSLDFAEKALARGVRVIDLSGAFRMKKLGSYPKWYGFEHPKPELASEAVYGLAPWCESDGQERLVANPGCYATATLMAILPLLRERLVDPASIVVDAKSGATGAGKKAAENLLFTEVAENCLPYRIGRHQHVPEIAEAAAAFGGSEIDFHFSTHLLPVRRGIVAGIYARMNAGVSLAQVQGAYARAYASYPLVQHELASVAEKRSGAGLLSLSRVTGTANTQIVYGADGDRLYVHSLIDNLLKGAASQAVENLNRLLGLPLNTALQN